MITNEQRVRLQHLYATAISWMESANVNPVLKGEAELRLDLYFQQVTLLTGGLTCTRGTSK